MRNVSRNFLLASLVAIAFIAAAYKIANRPMQAAFALSTVPALPDMQKPTSRVVPNLQAQFVSSEPGKAVHAPSVVELRDGSLRAVWFSGSREGAGDVTIQTAVFNNDSQQWGP